MSSGTVSGHLYLANGERVGGVLARNNTSVAVGNSSTESSIFSFTVPAGAMETNRRLKINIIGTFVNNTGGNRTFRVRVYLGGVALLDKTTANVATNAAAVDLFSDIVITNVNSAAAQVAGMNWTGQRATTSMALLTDTGSDTIDTTSNQTLDITITNSSISASHVFTKLAAVAVLE